MAALVLHAVAVFAVPAQIAWNAYARADQHKRAIRLLAFGFSALATRQAISVTLGKSLINTYGKPKAD